MSKSPKLLSIRSYGDVDETISPRTWEDFGSSSDSRQGQFFLTGLGTDDSTIVILLFHYKDMFYADLTYTMHCNVCAPGCYLLRNRGPCKYPHIYSFTKRHGGKQKENGENKKLSIISSKSKYPHIYSFIKGKQHFSSKTVKKQTVPSMSMFIQQIR